MSLVVPWLCFPLVIGLLSLGFGMLVEDISGFGSGVLTLPIGFAGIVVLSDFTTLSGSTARLAVPAIVLTALVGLALRARAGFAHRLGLRRPSWWLVASALGVFAVYAAPVVLSGEATFAGYGSLDDTSAWFALIDRVMSAGRNVTGLPISTYETILQIYLTTGYPLGSMIPLGVGAKLVGQDVAWVIQPYFAFQALLLALALWALLRPLVTSERWRAAAVFVAAQPALLYAYSLWGSVKEMVTAALVGLVVVLMAQALRSTPTVRALVPIALASSALLAVLNVGGVLWVLPALLPLVVILSRLPWEVGFVRACSFLGMLLVLSLPTIAIAREFLANDGAISSSATGATALGALTHPLNVLQFLGIWPVGDFRNTPSPIWPTYLLLGLLLAVAVAGIALAVRTREAGIPLYLATCLIGCLLVSWQGSPWTVAKALAEGSPCVLLSGFAGVEALRRRGLALLGGGIALVLAAGVLWSNGLAFGGVRLAPRNQLLELAEIGKRFAGEGPTLITEFQPYGARHFLRGMAVYQQPVADATLPLTILDYRTLVLDNSPLQSRPPSPYRLVWKGRFYEVWQLSRRVPTVLDHVYLGAALKEPATTPGCGQVMAVAAVAAKAHGEVAAVVREPALTIDLGSVEHPAGWTASASGGVYPTSAGTIRVEETVPRSGRYGVWLGGFTPGSLTVTIDGVRVGSLAHQIEEPDQYFPVGSIELARGSHRVVLDYSRPVLQPGSTSSIARSPMGPLVLSTATEDLPVVYLPPSKARSLCGRSLNWIEAVA